MHRTDGKDKNADVRQENFAGFWLRVVASIIDAIIISAPIYLLASTQTNEPNTLIYLFLHWLYSSMFLSSNWCATPGKKLVGLKVYSVQGERLQILTFTQASVRFLLSLVSYILILPIFLLFLTQKKQTFHDYYAKTVVVNYYSILANSENKNHKKMYKQYGKILIIVVAIAALILFFTIKTVENTKSNNRSFIDTLSVYENNSLNNTNDNSKDGNLKPYKTSGNAKITYSINYNERSGEIIKTHYSEDIATWSPLVKAIKQHDNPRVENYIKNREYLENRTTHGSTVIFAAIKYKNNLALDLLIESQADLEAKDDFGLTPLFAAVVEKNTHAVKSLLKHGANMNESEKHGLYTPFTRAVSDNNLAIVKLFLESGVDVNYQDNGSETALTVASKGCRNIDMFKLLLDNGANPHLIDTYGKTTKTGLARYCKNKKGLKQFENTIKNYN